MLLFQSIACELINIDDTERLFVFFERILVILTKIHGRVNNLYGKAFALNACRKLDSFEPRESERLVASIDM